MFEIELLPDRELFKFNRQLPFFNWYYPFDTDKDKLPNPYMPLLAWESLSIRRLAIYIHIPFCDTVCSFCPFTRGPFKSDSEIDEYVSALQIEMETKRRFLRNIQVEAIFIGGGSPSVLTPEHIEAIGRSIRSLCDVAEVKEFTMEVEAKSVTREKLEAMRSIGVNRVSFGVQTFTERYRSMFALTASLDQVRSVASMINELFEYTNIDMIYGMAGQTQDELIHDALSALGLKTTTIDFYPLNNLASQRVLYSNFRSHGLAHLPATVRLEYRRYLDSLLQLHGAVRISGYSYWNTNSGNHSGLERPLFLYHDLVYGYHDDAVIGFGSSALSQIPGYNMYNASSRQGYVTSMNSGRGPGFSAFQIPQSPERGMVGFPYRGSLDTTRVPLTELPEDTLMAFERLLDAQLITGTAPNYALSDLGWMFYVNCMYLLMPMRGKQWISDRIVARLDHQHECEPTELLEA